MVLRTPLHNRALVFLCSAWFYEPWFRSKTPFPLCHCLIGRCLGRYEAQLAAGLPDSKARQARQRRQDRAGKTGTAGKAGKAGKVGKAGMAGMAGKTTA